MKTLHTNISTKEDAIAYLVELHQHKLLYHQDDNVYDIVWGEDIPTPQTLELMNIRQHELFNIENFDPHEVCVSLINEDVDANERDYRTFNEIVDLAPFFTRENDEDTAICQQCVEDFKKWWFVLNEEGLFEPNMLRYSMV